MDGNSLNDKCITVSLNHGLDFLASSDFKMTGILPNNSNILTQPSASNQLLPSLFCNYNFVAASTNKSENIPASAIYIQQKSDVNNANETTEHAVNGNYSSEESSKEGNVETATVQVQFKPAYPANTENGINEFQAVQSAFAIKNEIDNLNTESESLQEHLDEAYQNYTCDFDSLRNDFNIDGAITEEAKLLKLESEEGFPLQVITQEFDTSECDAQSLQMMIKKEMYFESGLENGASDAIIAGLQQNALVSGNKAISFHPDSSNSAKPKPRFECEYCHRTFSKLTCLRVHQRVHLDERPYKCDECGLSFSTDLNLKIHQKVHNGNSNSQFKCKLCGKCFGQLQSLKSHQKVHTAETPYKCEVCQEYFTTSAKLKVHRMIHSAEKPLEYCAVCSNVKRIGEKCELCEAYNIVVTGVSPMLTTPVSADNSSNPPNVVVHPHTTLNLNVVPTDGSTHSVAVVPTFAPAPSTSPECATPPSVSPTPSATMAQVGMPSAVTVPHLVKQHQVIKKPFKCSECDKCFSSQKDLEFHELRHKDSKPFKCEYCNRGFSRKFNMQRHEKIHAGGAQV